LAEKPAPRQQPKPVSRTSPDALKTPEKGRTGKPASSVEEGEDQVQPQPLVMKRRKRTTEEELRKQLLKVPELILDPNGTEVRKILRKRKSKKDEPVDRVLEIINKRPDLKGLPVLKGKDCRLERKPAKELENIALRIRGHLERQSQKSKNYPQGLSTQLAMLQALDSDKGQTPEMVTALHQLLTAEDKPLRLLLVDRLGRTPGKQSSAALARRALFDLDSGVREAALWVLKNRPSLEYRDILLDGLRYPWAPVANHAAEALVALRLREAVPRLQNLLKEKGAFGPFARKEGRQEVWFTREVVRINHLKNCFLCHAPSFSVADPVRGLVPTPGRPIPSSRARRYYQSNRIGSFVRADVTYLRQDFSVPQPVAEANKWPKVQRFDFLVRTRPLTPAELAAYKKRGTGPQPPCEQREAVAFALRELIAQKPSPPPRAPEKVLPKAVPKPRP
jgi:hypothetical protein